MQSAARVAIPVVALRAVIVWALSRAILTAIVLAGGMSPVELSPPPFVVALFAGALGLLDVHMRGERILWANLGVGRGMLYSIYVAAAIPGEIVLAFVTR